MHSSVTKTATYDAIRESPVANLLLHCICLHFPSSILCLLDAEQLILILLDSNHGKTSNFLESPIKVLQQFPIKVYLSTCTILCRKCENECGQGVVRVKLLSYKLETKL